MAGKNARRLFYLKMIAASLLRKRSRMITAVLAIALGAAVISGLATLSREIPRQMSREFRSYGANLALIPAGGAAAFSQADLDAAKNLLPPDATVGLAPYRFTLIKINEQPFMAAGTIIEETKKTNPYWFVQGRRPESSGEALIGREVAETLHITPGSVFTVEGSGIDAKEFTVSGIVESGGAEEAFVYMSLNDFAAMTGTTGTYDSAECSISAGADALENLAQKINIAGTGLEARLVKQVTRSEAAVLSKLTALIFLVTAVVLVLIMICVSATMLAVISERRKEIGLRKALGAERKNLVAEFLGEGALLGFLGGTAGSFAGFGFARFAGLKIFSRPAGFDPAVFAFAALLAIVVTVLSCVLPVRSAASIDPAIVLRGE